MNNINALSSLFGMFGVRLAFTVVVLVSCCAISTTASPLTDRRYVPLNHDDMDTSTSTDVAWLWFSLLTRASGVLLIIYYALVAMAQRQQKGFSVCLLALATMLASLFLFYQQQQHDDTKDMTNILYVNPDVLLLLVAKCIYDMACVHYQIQSVLVWVLPDMGMIVSFLVLHVLFVMNNSVESKASFYSGQDQGTTFFAMGLFFMLNATVRFFCYRQMIFAIELEEQKEEAMKKIAIEDDEQPDYELLIV
jgi:hypothetical protein